MKEELDIMIEMAKGAHESAACLVDILLFMRNGDSDIHIKSAARLVDALEAEACYVQSRLHTMQAEHDLAEAMK